MLESFNPCSDSAASGLVLAVVSAFCNGSFSALSKTGRVHVPPHIFNLWACCGVVITGAASTLLVGTRCATPLGLLSGALFCAATACAFGAIQLLGLSLAAGVWCGTAVLVSFAFGAAVDTASIASPPFAAAGVLCIVSAIAGLSAAGMLDGSGAHARARGAAASLWQPLLVLSAEGDDDGGGRAPGTPPVLVASPAARWRSRLARGLALSLACGVLGGLILAPLEFVGFECRGLPFLPSMAAGVALAAPLSTLLVHWALRGRAACASVPPLQPADAAARGIASGVIWSAGNAASILAVQAVGLAIAYPIMQCGLFVSGLIGVLWFGELRGLRVQLMWWASGAVLIAGAALLAASGRAR